MQKEIISLWSRFKSRRSHDGRLVTSLHDESGSQFHSVCRGQTKQLIFFSPGGLGKSASSEPDTV